MDDSQLAAFLAPMFDDRVAGVTSDGDTYGPPICPELRSYLAARLGNLMLRSSYEAVSMKVNHPERMADIQSKRTAFAALLREAADDLMRPSEDRRIS
jgi:hypothetical protein